MWLLLDMFQAAPERLRWRHHNVFSFSCEVMQKEWVELSWFKIFNGKKKFWHNNVSTYFTQPVQIFLLESDALQRIVRIIYAYLLINFLKRLMIHSKTVQSRQELWKKEKGMYRCPPGLQKFCFVFKSLELWLTSEETKA